MLHYLETHNIITKDNMMHKLTLITYLITSWFKVLKNKKKKKKKNQRFVHPQEIVITLPASILFNEIL